MADIAIIGTGYVGLTTGACFAHLGHNVICADVVPGEGRAAAAGRDPDPRGRPRGAGARGPAVRAAAASCSARPTPWPTASSTTCACRRPRASDGSADLSYIEAAAREISPLLAPESIVVNKSTVPVGSTRRVEQALGRSDVFVVSNPEFLREGSAVSDFLHPDRVVIGSDDQAAAIRVAVALHRGAGAAHGHRPGLGRDHQVRQQRLPGHQALVRQRGRRRVRGGRAPTSTTSCSAWATTSASATSSCAPGPGGVAAASPRTCRHCSTSPGRPATTSTCSTAW